MTEDQRLGRIEDKLDKLSEAVVSLARMEERMITLFKRMDSYERRQDDIEDRLSEAEKTSVSRGAIYKLIDKGAWIIVGVLAAKIVEFYFNR